MVETTNEVTNKTALDDNSGDGRVPSFSRRDSNLIQERRKLVRVYDIPGCVVVANCEASVDPEAVLYYRLYEVPVVWKFRFVSCKGDNGDPLLRGISVPVHAAVSQQQTQDFRHF